MKFGDKVKLLREREGLKQSEFGKALKVSDKAISMWENNQRVPKMGVVSKIAAYFGVSIDYLVNDTEEYAEEITFDDFDFALKAETKELTEEQKNILLNMAKMLRDQNK